MRLRLLLLAILCPLIACDVHAETPANFRDENLVAWCIVPFDSKHRSPAERAAMVRRLGLRMVAYDWRQNHVSEFEEEIQQYKQHGIEYFAFWGAHEAAFKLFEKYDLHPQVWQTLPSPAGATNDERVKSAAEAMLPLVERTREMGCQLGLYNHGGWGGEPENMIAVCQYLRQAHDAKHVGLVYNLHHGHSHVENFAKWLARMQPYLLCLNLNGMTKDGDQRGQKILPLGEGEFDVALLRTIREAGYRGPLGILGHTQDDVEQRLLDNLDGLHWMLPQLDGKPPGPKPVLRTWTPVRKATGTEAETGGVLFDGKAAFRTPPLTVECRARLADAHGYNIRVASDTKQSGEHWEMFSMNGSGLLTVYLPGCRPDHVRSESNICDGRLHTLAMIYEPRRVRLYVDGQPVADQAIESLARPGVAGDLGIGRLVEGRLGCRGTIDWVRISRGIRPISAEETVDVKSDASTLLLWQRDEAMPNATAATGNAKNAADEYSAEKVARLVEQARKSGDPHRGLVVFANARSACISCHRIGSQGGAVGPALTEIGKQRKPAEIVESVLWPKREVKPEFAAHMVVDVEGRTYQGYIVRRDEKQLVLRDPQKCENPEVSLLLDDIDLERETGTLMPDNLASTMNDAQLVDLLSLLISLGTSEGIAAAEMEALLVHASAHAHGPAEFPLDRRPLNEEQWPHWRHPVNRDRVYDFYAKQADYFRSQPTVPPLLAEFPGLDGGQLGHWGNQNDSTWEDDRWNQTQLGSLMCGVFRHDKVTVPRGVCVRFGDDRGWSACFNPDTLTYESVWQGGFVKFSSRRSGFLGGLQIDGAPVEFTRTQSPRGSSLRYHGFYRHGDQVLFSYAIDGVEMLDAPHVQEERFEPIIAPAATHPLRHLVENAPAQWPQEIATAIELGDGHPYAVDTIHLPFDNPWQALLFCGGHGFLPDGSALVCTMQGDVWHVSGFQHPSRQAKWRRFASGLHHALGMIIDSDGIFVLGRDQITRLHDLNHDGEADFYECFSQAYETSPAGHDFICGLQRDATGNFYTVSGNQGLVRISADGQQADVIATGFRNPDGLGLLPDGTLTVPCSEGSWTPASMICAIPTRPPTAAKPGPGGDAVPHFGFGGPRGGRAPELPLVYLPRGLDNSSGGQVHVASDRWGPLQGQLLHLSFGAGSHFLILRDEVDGQLQGAAVPLPGDFDSGVHRGRFCPQDGQLYVTGMQGWGSYTPEDGCFQRVRFAGKTAQLPVGFHAHENGVLLEFSAPLDKAIAAAPKSHFAQAWNYRYSAGYGSPEFSTRHLGMRGHDAWSIASAHVLPDGRSLFLEIPELQLANQLHLRVQSAAGTFHDLFLTVHRLDAPYREFPGYQPTRKTIEPHPLLADLAMVTRSVPNPHRKKIDNARPLRIETGTNLSYQTRVLRVRPGEPIAFTLANPDVVPHNWALVKPGALDPVGGLADRLISDPEASLRHYIPATSDVLAYCDMVLPREEFTIYFRAPELPGRYPFLCTFPGHWKVMNGVMIVESPDAGK
ncbi:MAG: TIM barrel protein [Planctomycetales bacterium]|nr:TIM barrel protein [Planctomycetales bacterium]